MGRRLVILPKGAEPALGDGRIPIWIESGGIFGTGGHPTTRLCLKALECLLPTGGMAADIGTGTGILAVAAAKLGAPYVLAVDNDPDAVRAASRNVRLNGAENQVAVRLGSVERVRREVKARGPVSLAVANILADVLEDFFSKGLVAVLQPGGGLVLSGFLAAQTPAIRACLVISGFELLSQEREREWICLLARRLGSPERS
jgi:ribosomal protein L11 methyltransferase